LLAKVWQSLYFLKAADLGDASAPPWASNRYTEVQMFVQRYPHGPLYFNNLLVEIYLAALMA
jgi:hypothetical protein